MDANNYKVIITTSGVGSRLGELTNYTNKSLIRIGKKPAISYIVESYPDDIEIIITLGYFGSHVRQFLTMAYPVKKFIFVEIEKYTGEGSSLAYSLLQVKKHVQCPFIFHASDTLVFEKITDPYTNWLGFTNKDDSSQYRTLKLNSDLKIYEKGELNSNDIYIGLAGIKDFESFWTNLESEYNKDPLNTSLSDCHAISLMLDNSWKTFEFKSWQDIGNVTSLRNARKNIQDKFEILDKNDESIFIFDDFVIKFFYDVNTCVNRSKRGKKLLGLVPEILSSSDNFYQYKFCKGDLFSSVVNEKNFTEFLNWSIENLWKENQYSENFKNTCYDFYISKTIKRINKFLEDNNTKDEETIINGIIVPPVFKMIEKINTEYICSTKSYQFHGDYILDNIIKNENVFKLIDWRQDFGGDLDNGDIYYDLAKLNHNLLFNHEIINNGHFFIKKDGNEINCDILRSDNLTNCREILHNFIEKNNFDLDKVKILTSLIWINMAPLHETKIGNFLFYFGKLNLYKNIIKYEKY
jgi:NDP-sugar pyrophosphorylase family protein